MNILHLDSSILGDGSVTRRLGAELVDGFRGPNNTVVYRDLAADPIAHLSGQDLAQRGSSVEDPILAEFLAADVVIIGAPMYNFSIPSQLKAWIDHIAVAGKTFKYTDAGPVGLTGGKQVIIVSSRGGLYGDASGRAALDHQETYLKTIFGFLGVNDLEFITAEGVNLGPEHKTRAVDAALTDISGRKLAA
jgi:FMN-dependent NADH-azoreductase